MRIFCVTSGNSYIIKSAISASLVHVQKTYTSEIYYIAPPLVPQTSPLISYRCTELNESFDDKRDTDRINYQYWIRSQSILRTPAAQAMKNSEYTIKSGNVHQAFRYFS